MWLQERRVEDELLKKELMLRLLAERSNAPTTSPAAGSRNTGSTSSPPLYFSGAGDVTITGPGGTVHGQATFQDLSAFPPPEFDLLFTSITSCHLR